VSAFSNYLENKILLHVLDNTAYTSPTTVYLGLHTADPTDAGSGTEVSGGSYARQSVAFTVTDNAATNDSAIEFPTATGTWGTIGWVAVWDNLTSGNMLFHGSLTSSKTIASGDVFRVPAGDLDITLD
jgi:hypothetical protein